MLNRIEGFKSGINGYELNDGETNKEFWDKHGRPAEQQQQQQRQQSSVSMS